MDGNHFQNAEYDFQAPMQIPGLDNKPNNLNQKNGLFFASSTVNRSNRMNQSPEVFNPRMLQQPLINTPSVNNDTYSGFFSGTSLSQSEISEEIELLTPEEMKLLPKQKVGCSSSSCTVCFEKYSKGQVIRVLPCGHKFHYKCLKPWLKTSVHCPLCRFDLKTYCQKKIQETITEEGVCNLANKLEIEADCEELKSHKHDQDESRSNTFIETSSNVQEFKLSLPEESIFDQHNQIKNEAELKRRVFGGEAVSNLSFFVQRDSEAKVNFGIEDQISEIHF